MRRDAHRKREETRQKYNFPPKVAIRWVLVEEGGTTQVYVGAVAKPSKTGPRPGAAEADSEENASCLHVHLNAQQRRTIRAQESLLLDSVWRLNCDRWARVCSGFWASNGLAESVADYTRLILNGDERAPGVVDTARLARFQDGLNHCFRISITIEPAQAPIYCLPVGVERSFGISDDPSAMIDDTSLVQPLLQLWNGQCMHLKGNARNYGFLLVWSTVKAARVEYKDSAEGAVPVRRGDAFTREVHRKIWGLKRTVEDSRNQQDRLKEKYDKMSNDVNEVFGFVRQLEEATKGTKPAAVGQHFVTYGVPESGTQ